MFFLGYDFLSFVCNSFPFIGHQRGRITLFMTCPLCICSAFKLLRTIFRISRIFIRTFLMQFCFIWEWFALIVVFWFRRNNSDTFNSNARKMLKICDFEIIHFASVHKNHQFFHHLSSHSLLQVVFWQLVETFVLLHQKKKEYSLQYQRTMKYYDH